MSVDEFVNRSDDPRDRGPDPALLPDADILSAGGFLQLAFFSEAILVVSIATAVLVGGWASDEGERRLELILSAPMSRAEWAIRSSVAVMVGVAVIAALMTAGVVAGAATQAATRDLFPLAAGVMVLGLYAMALAGIGLAAAAWSGQPSPPR